MTMIYFRYPFATDGDKTAVPVTTQPSGVMSYQAGYPTGYSLDPDTDPLAKTMDRGTFNQLMFDMTSAIKQYQTFGAPEWITSAQNGGTPYPYDQGARVAYRASGGDPWVLYESLTTANTVTPTPGVNWRVISVSSVTPSFGQCQLVIDGTDLRLNPKDGNVLSIDGADYTITSAGVALAPTGAATNTTYNIYAYISSGVIALERSATATAVDADTGMVIKNGDPSRSFVGTGRTDGSSAWSLAISHFNTPVASIGVDGYRINPDGTIEQWGRVYPVVGDVNGVDIVFPVVFPTACLSISPPTLLATSLGTEGNALYVKEDFTATGFTITYSGAPNADLQANGMMWRALGH